MSNWKIEVSIPAVRVRYIINIMMNDIKERNVSIPAVRVRYIYYHRADTQSQVHVSIPAARVRYISKNNENAQKNLQYNLCSFLSLLFYYSESLKLCLPFAQKSKKIFQFLYFHRCEALFYRGKITPEKVGLALKQKIGAFFFNFLFKRHYKKDRTHKQTKAEKCSSSLYTPVKYFFDFCYFFAYVLEKWQGSWYNVLKNAEKGGRICDTCTIHNSFQAGIYLPFQSAT